MQKSMNAVVAAASSAAPMASSGWARGFAAGSTRVSASSAAAPSGRLT